MTVDVAPKRLLVTSALFVVAVFACGEADAPPGAPPIEPDVTAPDASPAPESDAGAPVDATPDASTIDAAPPKTLRVMTYNIKHGEIGGLDGIAAAINAEAPDLVGLQEVDVDAARSGNVDQAHRLGQLTGMTSLFRTAFNFPAGGSYGVALLSRFPVLTSKRIALTSSGEQRILAVVDVELAKGRVVPIGITHMDLQAAARATQATEIVAELGKAPLAVLMGDLNAQPDAPAVKTLADTFTDAWTAGGTGTGYTIPVNTPRQRIDYVFLGKGWPKPTGASVPTTTASDHLPVVIDVPLPP